MVGAGIKVLLDTRIDPAQVAPGDERVDKPVTSAGSDIGVGESQAAEILPVAGEPDEHSDPGPGDRPGTIRIGVEDDSQGTLVYSSFSAGGLVGALLVARRSAVSIRTVALGAAGLGAAMLGLSAVPSVPLALVVATLVGAASVAYMTATTSIAQLRTEPHIIGRVLALQTVLLVGTAPIGGPILGAIADAVGVRAPVLIGGAAALAAAAFGVLAAHRVDARQGDG